MAKDHCKQRQSKKMAAVFGDSLGGKKQVKQRTEIKRKFEEKAHKVSEPEKTTGDG